jgi:cobalamin biosynthetic protein CobC
MKQSKSPESSNCAAPIWQSSSIPTIPTAASSPRRRSWTSPTICTGDAGRNTVVLRSFGKFFGLAGLRLGFALAAPDIASRLDAALGPWAVAGPAIVIGAQALADQAWQIQTRKHLAAAATRLDTLLAGAGLEILGGTPLFRLTRCASAGALFKQLGRAGILVRRFAEDATWLRWGLPQNEAEWQRLSMALSAGVAPDRRQ